MAQPECKIADTRDLDEAIELAFWGVDFEDRDPKNVPFDLRANPTITVTSYRARDKSGHDATKGCFVLLSHLMIEATERPSETTESGEALLALWDDGESLMYNITDATAGTFCANGGTGFRDISPRTLDTFRHNIKMALAAVTTLD